MPHKSALIALCRDEVAPRFDMSAEVLIVPLPYAGTGQPPSGNEYPAGFEERHLVLAHVSGEELCDVVTRSGASVVVCGGIEEDYFHYLRWKRIEVICDIMGPAREVVAKLACGELQPGDCLYKKEPDE